MNEIKDHPTLFSWYANDEPFSYFNKYIRNIPLIVHELDPNHSTYQILLLLGETPDY